MTTTIDSQVPFTSENTDPEGLQDLKYQVQSRVGGLVREVRLLRIDSGLVLRGWSRTYYGKQLAQTALFEVTTLALAANEIDVL
jgi:type IV secretory pathway TrbF-like protein